MEFLGIGYQELLLVLVLLLVVVGPERLPGMAYQIGRAVRQMQGYARAVRDEFKDEIDYLDEQYKVVKGQVDEAQRSLRTEQVKLNTELREMQATVDSAVAAPSQASTFPPVTATAVEEPGAPERAAEADEPASPPMVF